MAPALPLPPACIPGDQISFSESWPQALGGKELGLPVWLGVGGFPASREGGPGRAWSAPAPVPAGPAGLAEGPAPGAGWGASGGPVPGLPEGLGL